MYNIFNTTGKEEVITWQIVTSETLEKDLTAQ
jgi:hypothetical protein